MIGLHQVAEWGDFYINYKKSVKLLDKAIKQIHGQIIATGREPHGKRLARGLFHRVPFCVEPSFVTHS